MSDTTKDTEATAPEGTTPAVPAEDETVTTLDNHMPAPPAAEVVTTLDNHMPAPPALGRDGK
ncbi:hypothetical protein [Streptomyces antibioticus]|uniref:Sigma-like protein n=1 Tax=Streptomyces antibioticus TaxID=1890 RepID=A0AAE6Y871_STRAT|nr:hypothetical protein [Streptomyces antibioticus]OOQ50972.1 hypothetical protein AFM16_17225 [Streptomyces antibioticus]QIT45123.1 hypothetical protein HCX60_17495 [Streptomyces antibioticus]